MDRISLKPRTFIISAMFFSSLQLWRVQFIHLSDFMHFLPGYHLYIISPNQKKYFKKGRASRIKPLNTNQLIQSPFSIFYLLQPHCLVFTFKLNQSDELFLSVTELQKTG